MYTLRFPFTLPDGKSITEPEFSSEINGVSITLRESGYHYVLVVTPFGSEDDARAYLNRIRTAMNWVLLTRDLPHNASYELQPVFLCDDPKRAAMNFWGGVLRDSEGVEELNAVFDASRPAIHPSVGTYRVLEAQPVTVSTSIRSQVFGETLLEGLGLRPHDEVDDPDTLATALDLYRAHFTESTRRARFLTLIMALEALAPPERRPPFVIDLIRQFDALLDAAKQGIDETSEESYLIGALKKEIVFRKDDSIRNRIRKLVYRSLGGRGEEERLRLTRDAVSLYDMRSDLLHKGTLPDEKLNEAMTKAKTLVSIVLRAQFLRRVQGDA